jgi:zinc transporter ZupT
MEYFLLFIGVVVASGGAVLWFQPKHNIYWVKLLLSFSGAFLFALIFLHLLPEVYDESLPQIGLVILGGFLLQLALDYFSKGIEHGHSHYHGSAFPLPIFIGLCIHSFFEGMPIIQFNTLTDYEINHSLIYGIMIHKIPIAIVLASLLKNYVSTTKAFLLIFLFAITLPLGSLTNLLVEQNIGNIEMYHHFILALVIGIMLHVSTTILYESDESHRFNLPKMVSVLLGFLVAFLGA